MNVLQDDRYPDAVWIEIVSLPKGDAPADLRRAWIGLRLYAPFGLQQQIAVAGVLRHSLIRRIWSHITGRYGLWDGYLVNAEEAIRRLASRDPDAAAWWRSNTPHLLQEGQGLIFEADCGADLGPPIPNTPPANSDTPPKR
jgi:hypothetical protein